MLVAILAWTGLAGFTAKYPGFAALVGFLDPLSTPNTILRQMKVLGTMKIMSLKLSTDDLMEKWLGSCTSGVSTLAKDQLADHQQKPLTVISGL